MIIFLRYTAAHLMLRLKSKNKAESTEPKLSKTAIIPTYIPCIRTTKPLLAQQAKTKAKRSVPGIEPGTSCTRSRNHTSRPNGRHFKKCKNSLHDHSIILQAISHLRPHPPQKNEIMYHEDIGSYQIVQQHHKP